MAGVRGRSGRKKGSGLTAAQHLLRNTYRADRHGPLPDGARILKMPQAASGPSAPVVAPTGLGEIELAKWRELTTAFPHLPARSSTS